MPSKKPNFMKYVVAHAPVEGNIATDEAQKWIDQGYQPWGMPSIHSSSLTKTVTWIQIFIKAKEEIKK